tara:strand:- start:60 stop:263 length:204 start_codon:yes stop_codon:yes gene_type:complete
MTPREIAEVEAKRTYVAFLLYAKRTSYVIIAALLFAASCNFGVEEGHGKTGSGYNGEQYAPTNLKVK